MQLLVTAILSAVVVRVQGLSLLIGDQFQAVEVNGLPAAKTYLATGPQLYAGTFSSQYCLSVWLKCAVLPAVNLKPVTLLTTSKVNLGLKTATAGGLIGYSELYQGLTATVTAGSGLKVGTWLLVAVCACENQLSIATVKYKGTVSIQSQTISGVFREYDPRYSQIKAYGDGVTALTAQMLALTFTLDSCLTADILATQASQCSPYCNSCISPDLYSCLEYVQLLDPFKPTAVVNATPKVFKAADSVFGGRDYSSLSLAVTGWFKSSFTGNANLFRVRNKNCAHSVLPTDGCIVIAEYTYKTKAEAWVDTGKAANLKMTDWGPTLTDFSDNAWHFFSGSNCDASSDHTHCFSTFSGTPDCIITALSSPSFPFLVAAKDASVSIGDSEEGPMTGKVLDVRLYIGKCIGTTEAQTLLTEKQSKCLLGCSVCSEPDTCQTCGPGYYLDTGQCIPCNSCCETCTGGLSTECTSCASVCSLVAPGTCLCNSLFSLLFSV